MPAESPPSLRRLAPYVALGLALVAVGWVLRLWYGSGSQRAPGVVPECFYDGAVRTDCPRPADAAATDTAWIWAAVVDTLYVRVPGTVGPAGLIALAAETGAPTPPAPVDSLAEALVGAAPALPRGTALTLARGVALANQAPAPLPVLWTVGGKQRRVPADTARRLLTERAANKDEALPPRGLLTLARPAVDPARRWALAYATRTVAPVVVGEPASATGAYLLLHRERDGRWRVVRVLPTAAAVPVAPGAPGSGRGAVPG